ncbi:hypothetical protein ACFL7D_08110 [candidate division KSB1 bacterium]
MTKTTLTCPHCNDRLLLWEPPFESSWGMQPKYVCFNDDCSYFIKGWKRMAELYKQRASYRYCLNPKTGKANPLPVWSDTALKNRIIDEEKES